MVNRWGNSGNSGRLYFLGSKITADGDCSQEIKRCLLLERKVMTNLDSIFGEGNGTPRQYSCLENPMDGGAWWAAVHEVGKTERLYLHFSLSCIGEGNGSPLQCPCLESPRGGGAGGGRLWGRAGSDATEATQQQQQQVFSILKSRDVILPTKVRPVKTMVFPVVMYGCEMGLRQGTLEAPKNDRIKNFFTLHSMYKKINFLFFHN